MAKITDAQMQVLINCIGAVETGGQVYGQRRYNDYTNAYANSSAEDSITIGAFQEFKNNARDLLKDIKAAYPSTFAKYDNASLAADLNKSSWSGYNPAKTSAKAKAIVNIISSNDGKKVQDTRIVKLLNQYIAYAESLGVTDVDALFMCANFIHQGGNSACKRLCGKTSKPYTLDKLYNATLTDTGNQVGAYKSRQKLMYQWIKQYITNATQSTSTQTTTANTGGTKMTEAQLRSAVATWLDSYIGCTEGSAKHKEILSIFNNSGINSRYKMTTNDAWCATATSAAFIANKLAGKAGSGSLFECVECSCYYMVEAAKKQGIWVENDAHVPKTGDVVLYDWDDSGSGDNTGCPDHVGIVYSVSGNSLVIIEGNYSDTVKKRTLAVNGRYIRGYITPNYAKFAGTVTAPTTQTTTPIRTGLTIGDSGSDVKTMQKMLIACGYSCGSAGADGDFGNNTLSALKKFQSANGLTSDGVYGDKSRAALEALYAQKTKPAATTTTTTSGGLKRDVQWNGVVTASALNVRTWAGTENGTCSFSPIHKNDVVGVCDSVKAKDGTTWYYIKYNNKYGFVSGKYITKK